MEGKEVPKSRLDRGSLTRIRLILKQSDNFKALTQGIGRKR